MSNSNINFYFKFIKKIEEQYVTYNYCARFYTRNESGKFKLYGFNGTDEDAIIYVNDNKANYEKVFVMNLSGKTIDSYRISN